MATRPLMEEPRDTRPAVSRSQIIFQIAILVALVLLLLNYKGAAGISKIRQTTLTGKLRLASFPIGGYTGGSALSNALTYLEIVWPALLFGVLISAAARTSFLRTPLYTMFRGSTVRDQLTGALVGAPLMLCSCCVAPIFPAVYQRTRRVAPAVAMTLASPSLNPAALVLSFALFPLRIAGARLAMALLLVLMGSLLAAKMIGSSSPIVSDVEVQQAQFTWGELLSSYAESLVYISVRIVPLILLGIWISMWIMRRVPSDLGAMPGTRLFGLILVAFFAVLLTLPSLFEIPIALSVLAAGGPVPAAVAILFAGPAINLPSLLVIGRYSSWKVAAGIGGMVWLLAVVGGVLVS